MRLWIAAALLLVLLPLRVQAQQALDEAAFRQMLLIEREAKVEYLDEAGKPIDFAGFVKAVQRGTGFAKIVKSGDPTVRVQLQKPGTSGPVRAYEARFAPGTALPTLTGTTLDGKAVESASFLGQWTVLSFFFAQCAPCVAEIPALNAWRAAHPDIRALAITFDPKAEAAEFVAKRGLQWPVLPDAQDFIDKLGVHGYPLLLLIGPDGRIASRFVPPPVAKATGEAAAKASPFKMETLTAEQVQAWVQGVRDAAPAARPVSPAG